jgi:hypothetical protein
MSSCLLYITTVDYGQFNSYIDVIYPDLDVNVLMKYDISGKLIYHKIGMHNLSGSLITG